MNDKLIVDLLRESLEKDVSKATLKFSKYLCYTAFPILHGEENSEKCVNDTYMKAWHAIPPQFQACFG